MRRSALGLATALVGGLLAMPGGAHAGTLPAHITLANNSGYLQSGLSYWQVSFCANSPTVCQDLVLYSDGNGGVTLAGQPSGGAFTSINSQLTSKTGDLSFTLYEGTANPFSQTMPAKLSSASMSAVGATNGGSAVIAVGFPPQSDKGNVGVSGSSFPSTLTFTATNIITYTVDLPVSAGLKTATFGATSDVPEPASAGMLAIGLIGLGLMRRRSAR